jgi:hypothetical protein
MVAFPKFKALKLNYNLNPLLQNQLVLYLFFFLAIVDLFYLANTKDFATVTIIILTGFLTSFFSKNMIVILCISLCVGHIIKYGTGNKRREGAENISDSQESGDLTDMNDSSTEESSTKKKSLSKNSSIDEKKKAKEDLMKGLKEFQLVQTDLVNGIEKLQPMIEKAEAFVSKYENYRNVNDK